jgi:membrane fusion protein (multidrug efflux system)
MRRQGLYIASIAIAWSLLACGGDEPSENPHGRGGHGASGRGGSREPSPETDAGVPVEVAQPERRSISSFIETNGTLEAESDVDIVARTAGPVVELLVEEGMVVKKGQLLARIDDEELQSQVGIAQVALEEARRTHDRAKASFEESVVSQEVYDQTLTKLESAEAQLEGSQILFGYSKIEAPFAGIIIERYIKFAENVTPNQELFRISDFDPLLCPIQVPERELSNLKVSQDAYITVGAWSGERFLARVLRIRPVVDADTGTIEVTLQVKARGKLSPGMFASVYLVRDSHADALVIPKSALSLESLGDTVYVVNEGLAERRDIEIGFDESDFVEVLSGLSEEDRVVVVGQDGLGDGTPVFVLKGPGAETFAEAPAGPTRGAGLDVARGQSPERATGDSEFRDSGLAPDRKDPSQMTPEQLEQMKERMRQRGMSDEQIEKVLSKRLGKPQP